ncbi:MAG: zinc-binding protein [Planctomycetes bacterium GWF2_50_10]|nr:MAG: zinc-binding protein [Planctomycetes bacterium GWF2_50_10]
MSEGNSCSCSGGPKLIFACSGSADVGEIADHAARELAKSGVGKMFCTVGLGGRVSGIMKTTEAAAKILAIDGCPLSCVKNSLDQAGFTEYKHLQLAELGFAKCSSPVTGEAVAKVVQKGTEMMEK